ncbi:MAG: hypothetical protein CME63_07680 [Halobacteriovoraceae bacterium]|nr:hypothetical protein [Halobacteriovoraceae bacterium]|tara:strand:+ start:41745 stop:43187 length:1443 start_codon:yes stop_codon:yes gene_type:complete
MIFENTLSPFLNEIQSREKNPSLESFPQIPTLLIECPHQLEGYLHPRTSQHQENGKRVYSPIHRFMQRISWAMENNWVPILLSELPPKHTQEHRHQLQFGALLWRWQSETWELNPRFNSQIPQLQNFIEKALNSEKLKLIGLFSSGSTGPSKLIFQSLENYLASAKRSAKLLNLNSSTQVLSALPCYHNGGLLNLIRADLYGHPLLITGHKELLPQWKKSAPDIIIGVPTQLLGGIEENSALPTQTFYSGGAAIGAELLKKAQKLLRVIPTYGLTESCGALLYQDLYQDNNTTGFQPMDQVDFKIVNQRLSIRCPSLAHAIFSYHPKKNPAWNHHLYDGNQFFTTNDRANLSGDGHIEILGRTDQVMICSGENINPQEIADIINSYFKRREIIAQFQIMAIDDEVKGQIPVALIDGLEQWKSELRDELRDELVMELRQHLSPLKRPRYLISQPPIQSGIKLTHSEFNRLWKNGELIYWKI